MPDPSESVTDAGLDDGIEHDLSTIADAHAQFESVLTPNVLQPSDSGGSGNFLAYMGIDGWGFGGSAYTGGEWSSSSDSGFVLRTFASDGFDDFRLRAFTFRVETARAALLPGYRFRSGTLDIKLFAGADFILRMPLRPALDRSIQMFGARASADLWWEPAQNWMLSGAVSATTIERGLTGRFAPGWRSPVGWIGPEMLVTHDIYSTQYRVGAHLSGVQVGMTEWSLAGGYAQDSFGRSGPYGRLGITYRP